MNMDPTLVRRIIRGVGDLGHLAGNLETLILKPYRVFPCGYSGMPCRCPVASSQPCEGRQGLVGKSSVAWALGFRTQLGSRFRVGLFNTRAAEAGPKTLLL